MRFASDLATLYPRIETDYASCTQASGNSGREAPFRTIIDKLFFHRVTNICTREKGPKSIVVVMNQSFGHSSKGNPHLNQRPCLAEV